MINRIGVAVAFTTVLTAMAVDGAAAQDEATRMGGVVITAFAGGAAFSDLQRSLATARWPSAGGVLTRDFERRVSPATSPAFAGSVVYWPSQWWGMRVHGGFSPSRLRVTVSERETSAIPVDSAVTGGSRYARLGIWSYDASVMFRLPVTPRNRIAPYAFIGGGAMRYVAGTQDSLPPEARGTFENQDAPKRVAATLGIGALIPLRRHNLALSIELTDHLARTPIQHTTGGTNETSGMTVVMDPTRAPAGEGRVSITNHVRLLLGLSVLIR